MQINQARTVRSVKRPVPRQYINDPRYGYGGGLLGEYTYGWNAGGITPNGLADVQDTSLSNTFLDTINTAIGTITQGAVQYQLNKQAISAGQPIVGTTQGTAATAKAPGAAMFTPTQKVMLGVAGALGLYLVLKKRR